jgi:hypothetical protein
MFFDMDGSLLADAVKAAGSPRIAMYARYNLSESLKWAMVLTILSAARDVIGTGIVRVRPATPQACNNN